MFRHTAFRHFVPAFALTLGLSGFTAAMTTAQAESIYDPYAPYSNQYYPVQPKNVRLALSQRPDLPKGTFILEVQADRTATGCMQLSQLEHEVEFKDIYMNITVYGYTVDMRDGPAHPEYECKTTYQTPRAEITLSKELLEEHGTKHIRFSMGQSFDFYDIEITDERIMLSPSATGPSTRRFTPNNAANLKAPLVHWLYPENTVILYVPDVNKRMPGVREKVGSLAVSYGLKPLEDIYPDFESPLKAPHTYYFVDLTGRTSAMADEEGGGVLDTIEIDAWSYELRGDVPIQMAKDVYVRRPGLYE